MGRKLTFCACSFLDYIYIIGGHLNGCATNSCVTFDSKSRIWKDVSVMNEKREDAACAVFKGKVVVSGGYTHNEYLTSVEVYDHIGDSWSYMPNMVEYRYRHKSVAVKNKLFVVGGWVKRCCEVYDPTSNKFVLLKSPPSSFMSPYYRFRGYLRRLAKVTSIGSKLAVFGQLRNSVIFYDVENEQWSDESCDVTKNLKGYCCVKIPQFKKK